MQGFNKYYAPDYEPSSGSLNKVAGKHALGDRARKLDQGILIVRFELPYNIWCGGCGNHIGQGVRYNAEKKKVGMYYTTPILSFRCKCHLCQHWFEIRTDPANTRYVVHEGAKQKNEEWDPAENGTIVLDQKSEGDVPPDAFQLLEKTETQKKRALSAASHLETLEQLQASRWSDPYAVSSVLRKKFRGEKKIRLESEGRAEGTRTKYGLGDKITVDDLRTPKRPELKVAEDEQWRVALKERAQREHLTTTKREQDEERAGWRIKSKASVGSHHSSSRGEKVSRRSSTRSVISHPITRPSKSTDSPAISALKADIGLRTALARDPFASSSMVPKKSKDQIFSSGAVKIVRKE